MGAKRVKIEFTSNPVENRGIAFNISYDGVVVFNYSSSFHAASPVFIGEDKTETAVFLRSHVANALVAAGLSDAYAEREGDIVYVYFGNNTLDVTGHIFLVYDWANVSIEEYTFPEPEPGVPVVLDDAVMLSRSPYWFRFAPGIAFDSMTADLYIYTGHKDSDRPDTPTISLSKGVVYAGQSLVAFDLSNIVNGYVKNKYYAIGATGAGTTSSLDSVWCFVDASFKLAGEVLGSVEQLLFCVDGYGYHTQGYNPGFGTKVLSSITDHIFYGTEYPLFFLTDDLVSITINGASVPFTLDSDYNNQVVGCINVAGYAGESASFTAVFEYGDETLTHTFTKKSECRYPVINCIFKNKFGFRQSIPFNKLNKASIERTSSEYQGSISNFGQYDTIDHVTRAYQVNARKKVTVNTDFIPEAQNDLFTELYLSEFIYLEQDGAITPVTLEKNTFEYKTKMFNKMIQYTMDFKYSFDLMNNVR